MAKTKQQVTQKNKPESSPVTRQQLWEDLLNRGYVIAPSATTVSAHWLYEGENRLDGGYYGSNAQTATRIVNDCGYPVETLGNITQDIYFPGRYKRIFASDKQAGYSFLSASEALQFRPTSDRYLAKDHLPKNSEKHFIQKDWILMSRSGTVGRTAITTKRLANFFISDDLIRIIPKKSPLFGYVYAFLCSWIGQALITKDQYGSAIKHLESHHISSVPVPILPVPQQQLIHQEIISAYQLREKANQLLDEADELLHQELGLPRFDESLVPYLPEPKNKPSNKPKMPHLKAFTTSLSELGDRFDCSYHVPVAKTILNLLVRSKYPLVDLKEMAENITIPPRFKRIYVSKKYGIPFIRPSHLPQIKPYDLGYISWKTNVIKELLLHKGDILVTTDGTIGRISIVSSQIDRWAGSNNIARITYGKNNFENGYLAAFLMSFYGFCQLTKEIYGSVIDHIEVPHL